MSSNLEAFNRGLQVFSSSGFHNSNPEQEKNFHENFTDDAVFECHQTAKTRSFDGIRMGNRGLKAFMAFDDLIELTQMTPTILGEQGDEVYVRFTYVPVAIATGKVYHSTVTTMVTYTFNNGKISKLMFVTSFPNFPSQIL